MEQSPRNEHTNYFHQQDKESRSGDRGADDLRVDGGYFSAAESLVGFLVGELAGGSVVAVQAAGQRQVVPPAPVVSRVVGSAALQLPFDPTEGRIYVGVRLRIVVSIVHCVLDELVRMLSIDEHEDQHRGDDLQEDDEHQKQSVHPEEASALPVSAAPAAECDTNDEQSQEYEEPWRRLRPVHSVVQEIVVAIPKRHELLELHEEPDPDGRGNEPEHGEYYIHDVQHTFQ